MSLEIKGKNVLVTGANRGIGLEIVNHAIDRGANKVYAAVRDLKSAEPLVAEHGDRVVPVQIDLNAPDTIEAAAKTASDVDIVINNAGILKNANPTDDHAIDAFQQEIDVNVYGLMRMARAFAPVLNANGGGAFAQLNSVASLRTFPGFATYAASKAASYSITQALREQLGEKGIHVVSVHPGPIATDMASDAGLDDVAEPPSLVAEALFDAIEGGQFHAWPDSMSKQFAEAYQGFAKNVVESSMEESPA